MKNLSLSQNEDYSLFETKLHFLMEIFGFLSKKEAIASNSQKQNKLNPTQTCKIKAFLL